MVGRPSTYRGIFEEGHSSGRAEENQCDASHAAAEAKSDAFEHGGALGGVRFPTFPRPLDPLHAVSLLA